MHRLIAAALLLFLPAAAPAADRTVGIGSFTRLRVDGAFDVRVAVGGSPRARISGDARALDAVEVRNDGGTLTVRRTVNGAWGEQPQSVATSPVVVTLATPMLGSAFVTGASRVAIDRMVGPRIDLAVTGTGGLTVGAAKADMIDVTAIGSGSVAVGGTVAKARLTTNGPAIIDAGALDAGDLVVHLDGLGTTKARARYSASVDSSGLGTVEIAGNPKCTVRAPGGSPVTCGGAAAR